MTDLTMAWNRVHTGSAISGQVLWYGAGAIVGFLIPFVFSATLDLNHDLYYGIYFAGVLAFLGAYVWTTGMDVRSLFTRHWRWSAALGAIAAVVLVFGVLNREDSTARPDGLYFVFSVAWRGLTYGVIDALLLTAFPVAVAHALFGQRLGTHLRRIGFGVIAFALVTVITATYHLGYEQFRDGGVAGPETGNAIISLPAILTVNPLGSVIAHASMHVAADIHAYETDLYLPPQTFVEGTADLPAEVQLTRADSGTRIDLAEGGTLIIALPSNHATGHWWQVVEPVSQLRQEGDPRYVPPGSTSPVPGAGGTEVFTFSASERGNAQLELEYLAADGSVEDTFTVDVTVR